MAEALSESFAALAIQQGVLPGTKHDRRERGKFITNEFQTYFGEETRLKNWQKLCVDVGIKERLTTIKQCRKALREVWVNIWDLLDAVKSGGTVKVFKSKKELIKYTFEKGKVYPKAHAKQCGPVRDLLRNLN